MPLERAIDIDTLMDFKMAEFFSRRRRIKHGSTIKKLMNLKGRRVMVTGATGGLGSVMVDTLAELGADLILVDRRN